MKIQVALLVAACAAPAVMGQGCGPGTYLDTKSGFCAAGIDPRVSSCLLVFLNNAKYCHTSFLSILPTNICPLAPLLFSSPCCHVTEFPLHS